MRILFLALDIELGLGRGDAVHPESLARALVARGHEVTLVAATSKLDPDTLPAGLRVVCVKATSTLGHLTSALRIALASKPEVIYERRFSPKISFALSILLRIPYAVEINGWVEDEARMQGRPLPTGMWRRKLRAWLFRRANAIVAVTPGLAASLVHEYGLNRNDVHVVPNGANTELFRPMDRISARKTLGLSPDAKIILYVGNLAPWQALDGLIRAVKILQGKGVGAMLVVVGDGPERLRLEHLANQISDGWILFTGMRPHNEVPLYVASSDVCVHPGTRKLSDRMEFSPLKIREYAAGGRPTVASDVPGAGTMVEELGIGLSFRADDERDLADKLHRILGDPTLSEALGRRAREVCEERLSWAHVSEQIERILASAVGDSATMEHP